LLQNQQLTFLSIDVECLAIIIIIIIIIIIYM